jgi:hypothetical protein
MNPNLLIAVRGVTLGIILALAYGDIPQAKDHLPKK